MADGPSDLAPATGEFLLYAAPGGGVKVRVLVKDETVWLTQKALAELFGVGVPAVAKHLGNIFESGELQEESVVSILETTAADGKNYLTRFHNLDTIIAVGYRVNSHQATQFRIWATKTLREFIVKGFVLDDERLKQGKTLFGKDYFDATARWQAAQGEKEEVTCVNLAQADRWPDWREGPGPPPRPRRRRVHPRSFSPAGRLSPKTFCSSPPDS